MGLPTTNSRPVPRRGTWVFNQYPLFLTRTGMEIGMDGELIVRGTLRYGVGMDSPPPRERGRLQILRSRADCSEWTARPQENGVASRYLVASTAKGFQPRWKRERGPGICCKTSRGGAGFGRRARDRQRAYTPLRAISSPWLAGILYPPPHQKGR